MCYYRTGSDDSILTDADPLEDDASSADECIAADMDRSRFSVLRMAFGDVGREAMPVTISDECASSDHGIVIDSDALVADDCHSAHTHMTADDDLCRWCLRADARAMHRSDVIAAIGAPDAAMITNDYMSVW